MYIPETTKYQVHLGFEIEGVVEKSDVIGAIFGQTEGLLGEDLDLRDLQRSGRIGRIDVSSESKKGETRGEIIISSSLDKAETAVLAASLETIERVGPCSGRFKVKKIEDIRIAKRKQIVVRAKEILIESFDEGVIDTNEILDQVREYTRIEKVVEIGDENLPAGPNVESSDAIIIVEGRADVINLLRYGIKNAIAVEGTKIPASISRLCEQKTATAFPDGDRGGDLILKELLQVAEIDYVALCPRGRSVEEMSRKEIIKSMRNKIPAEQITGAGGDVNIAAYAHAQEEMNKTPDNSDTGPGPVPVDDNLQRHMEEMRGESSVRFLSEDYETTVEIPFSDIEAGLKKSGPSVSGIITDQTVNQAIVDIVSAKNLDFIAAPDFRGIIKKPVNIRLLKIP
ncbi:MAG: DNA primase [Methanomicrobiaceae archaeon]|nr:DNA primase [Methanomicrobiaceae archaeon]